MRKCNSCGEEISAARLAAKPSASLCLVCQTEKENNAPKEGDPVAYFTREQLFGYQAHIVNKTNKRINNQ